MRMVAERSVSRRWSIPSAIRWSLLTMISFGIVVASAIADPKGFTPDHIWVNTDYRTKLVPTYSGREILGQWALLENQHDKASIETECPGLGDKVRMNAQGMNKKDILRIEVDGRPYCLPQGEEVTAGGLKISLVRISRDWVSFQDPATQKAIPYGNADLSIQRTSQPYLTIVLLLASALLGLAFPKAVDAVTASRKTRRPRAPRK